jgi:hypothetical protein
MAHPITSPYRLWRARAAKSAALWAGVLAAWSIDATAAPTTVCTVTINSSDEKEAFQRHLPGADYAFVELVQRGRPDWLAAARRSGVRCDVLMISGHFDDGTEFYTDRHDDREFLTVHEMQNESCSASRSGSVGAPVGASVGTSGGALDGGLFSQLKEVYLFGCNTLKTLPRHVASAEVVRSLVRAGYLPADADREAARLNARYGQSNLDRLRHVFKDVPVLYGFSSKAPLGRTAGPLLESYFRSAPAGEVGSGRPSATLLKLFGPSSMVAIAGLTDADPHASFRNDMCAFADEGHADAKKLSFLHQVLQRDVTDVRMFFDHLERYVASLDPARRQAPEVAAALALIKDDRAARDRYLAFARDADESTVQVRMMAMARALGWLTPAQEQAAFVHTLADRMARGTLGPTEVDLACAAPGAQGSGLDQPLLATGAVRHGQVAHLAVLACLGNRRAHAQTVSALTSPRDDDVAIVRTYLRHRSLADLAELRTVATGIVRMKASNAQVRALETLSKQHLSDPQSLQEIARLFPLARSLDVQRAIASILIRADTRLLPQTDLAHSLRQHRLKSPDGHDVIDMLIRLLRVS